MVIHVYFSSQTQIVWLRTTVFIKTNAMILYSFLFGRLVTLVYPVPDLIRRSSILGVGFLPP